MIIFEQQSLDRIKRDAISRYPKECCGILIGRRNGAAKRIVEEAYPTPNEALGGQERQFLIHPMTLLQAENYAAESGREIVGFYHSHPNCRAEASKEDERCALPECSYPILSVVQGQVLDIQSWTLKGEGLDREDIFTHQYNE